MKNTRIFSFLLIALISLFAISCEGPVGPPGRDGFDGNANVIYSLWYTPTGWDYDNLTEDWYFQVESESITEDIVESGVILAYMSVPGDVYDGAVRPMPAYALGCNWDFLIPGYGAIEFTSTMFDSPGTTDYYFRFILIPSENQALKSALKSKNINELKKMPYKQICTMFNIPEK